MSERNISHVTACQCIQEGLCARHGCFKDRQMFLLCQRSRDLFERWEQGNGPGQIQDPAVRKSRLRVLKEPCRHRSTEPVGEIQCELCGAENRMLPVYACTQFEECTLYRSGRSERAMAMGACIGCERYEPAAEQITAEAV